MSLANTFPSCSPGSIPYPTLFGASFLSLTASPVTNLSTGFIPGGYYSNHGPLDVEGISFCNVTVTYTHPGQNDRINVQVWLPPAEQWNSRLQSMGGAGWQAGLNSVGILAMAAAISEGYATSQTDAGLPGATDLNGLIDPKAWALLSEGNVNLYNLQNLASVSLGDMAVIAKNVTASYYGREAEYSYFSGCSQGGRQAMMLAQRYPNAYDGIAAGAPVVNWNQFFVSTIWPGFVMDELETYPPGCEVDAITAAAIEGCDGDDGVIDGVISDPERCGFDPMSVVGQEVDCGELGMRKVSEGTAKLVEAVWTGPKRADGSSIWYGFNPGTILTATDASSSTISLPLIPTTCSANGTCTRTDFALVAPWPKLFVLKSSSASLSHISHAEFDDIVHASFQIYESMIGTNDPDLSEFRDKGGKIISWHGMVDAIVPSQGSEHYYDQVLQTDSAAHDYFRLFLAPGVEHCWGGSGAYPGSIFDALKRWVENGTAPETIEATSPSLAEGGTEPVFKRYLCPYPKMQVYDGKGNVTAGEGFSCV